MKTKLPLIALATLALAACQQQADAPASAATASTPAATVSATPTIEPAAGEKPLAFTAYGADFRAVVDQGKLSVEGPTIKVRTLAVTEARFAKGTDFTGEGVALTVRSGVCKDGGGKDTGMKAELEIDGKTYTGCAVEGAVPVADT